MKHRWKFALAASVLLAGASAAQEVDQNEDVQKPVEELSETAEDVVEETPDVSVEETAEDIAEAVEPEIEIPDIDEIAPAFSLADYEADQTGSVVDADAAARAMTGVELVAPEAEIEFETVVEELIPADEMEAVPMDSDEVEISEVLPGDTGLEEAVETAVEPVIEEMVPTALEAEDMIEEIVDPAAAEVTEPSGDIAESTEIESAAALINHSEDELEMVLEKAAVETEQIEAAAEDTTDPVEASEAVSDVLEEAGLQIGDE